MRRIPRAYRVAAAIAACTMMTGVSMAESRADKAVRKLSALTPDNVAERVTLKDDDLTAQAMFTTVPIYQETGGLFSGEPNDSFLRAFVDKRTGQVTWQVYTTINYTGPSWQFYEVANYQTSQGITQVPVTVIDRDVSDCARLDGCSYTEQLGFNLTDEVIRAIAKLYVPGAKLGIWRFRLEGQGGRRFHRWVRSRRGRRPGAGGRSMAGGPSNSGWGSRGTGSHTIVGASGCHLCAAAGRRLPGADPSRKPRGEGRPHCRHDHHRGRKQAARGPFDAADAGAPDRTQPEDILNRRPCQRRRRVTFNN